MAKKVEKFVCPRLVRHLRRHVDRGLEEELGRVGVALGEQLLWGKNG